MADPDWSPDGQSIVFGRLPDRMDNHQPKAIYIVHLQNRQVAGIPNSKGLVYFQDFLEAGKPIYRVPVPTGTPEAVATISNLRPISATDYRLIGWTPDDLPIISARTSTVNLYMVDLNER